MSDLTPRGVPIGAGKSKIRRKELEIEGLQYSVKQRELEILEKQEDIERTEVRIAELQEELGAIRKQVETIK